MAVININFDTIKNDTIPLLRKELTVLKAEKDYIEKSAFLRTDSDITPIYNNICNRYEEVQKQIRWLNLIMNDYNRNINEGKEAINNVKFPSVEKTKIVIK